MQEIVSGNFAPFRWLLWPPRSLVVVDWNIDRGLQLASVIDFLARVNADILILQEVDLNARRTHRLNVAEEIARKLQMNYVFGREFEELVQGTKSNPAYHGQAILSHWPISNPRLIRFSKQSHFWQPRWFLPRIEPFQERRGGRMALVAEINVGGSRLVVYDLHLESRGNDDLRVSQAEEVLSDARCWDGKRPVIVAGDLNLDVSTDALAVAFAKAGFQNAVAATRIPTTPSRGLFDRGGHIDWAFIRGPFRAIDGRVHNQVKASDHYPISFMLTA
jgi:endonuclease/exonuclease/phosphatase family metal-dependent hydrolase